MITGRRRWTGDWWRNDGPMRNAEHVLLRGSGTCRSGGVHEQGDMVDDPEILDW